MATLRNSVPFLVIGMISVGASVGTTLWLLPAERAGLSSPRAVESNGFVDPARLGDLEQRIAQIERDAPLRAAAKDPAEPEREPIDRTNEQLSLVAIEKRLAALEARMRELSAPNRPPYELVQRDIQRDAATSRDEEWKRRAMIATAKDTITDPGASVQDKVEAHSLLRRVDKAYTPAMAQEMIRIGLENPDESVRARVWTMFDGSSATSLPELVPNLLQVLAADQSGHARSEASETLGNFPDDPAAVAALEFTAKHDKDPNVRRKAARTLDEMHAGRNQDTGRR